MNVLIGIDPGITGAIAVISDDGNLLDTWDMPVSKKLSGKGNMVNPSLLHSGLFAAKTAYEKDGVQITVCIEQVNAMPGQGVTSMFGFGRSLGIIEGVCAGLCLPVVYVTPQAWKKMAGLTGKDKDAARTLAINKWPHMSDKFKRKKDVGRADAALIAAYSGKRMSHDR